MVPLAISRGKRSGALVIAPWYFCRGIGWCWSPDRRCRPARRGGRCPRSTNPGKPSPVGVLVGVGLVKVAHRRPRRGAPALLAGSGSAVFVPRLNAPIERSPSTVKVRLSGLMIWSGVAGRTVPGWSSDLARSSCGEGGLGRAQDCRARKTGGRHCLSRNQRKGSGAVPTWATANVRLALTSTSRRQPTSRLWRFRRRLRRVAPGLTSSGSECNDIDAVYEPLVGRDGEIKGSVRS